MFTLAQSTAGFITGSSGSGGNRPEDANDDAGQPLGWKTACATAPSETGKRSKQNIYRQIRINVRLAMGFFGKVKDGLKKASDNAKEEEDLDEGISIDGVVGVVSELNKRRKASK